MTNYPDRSRFDADVAAILNPLAQLRAENDALLAENESLLDREDPAALHARIAELETLLRIERGQRNAGGF
jgi:hypothetical protein